MSKTLLRVIRNPRPDTSMSNFESRGIRVVAFVDQGLLSDRLERFFLCIFRRVAMPANDFFAHADAHQPLLFGGISGRFDLVNTHENLHCGGIIVWSR